MFKIECFTTAGWYSYMERYVTEKHIYNKKAASKLDLGWGEEEVSIIPDCIYQG